MAAPISGKQAPGFYRQKVGDYEVTVVSDGTLTLDATIFTGDEAGAEKLLRDAHLPKMGFTTPLNTWLINTGQKLILVDAGGGTHFAPSIGRLPQNLAAAGVSPAAIDAVVITHPHPDHIPGVITADHKMLFPNATLYVNENDHAFWTSADIRGKAPEEFRGFFDLAVNAIKPYAAAGKLSLYKDGAEFAPACARSPATATPSATAWCGCRRRAATSSSSATSCIAWRCNLPIRNARWRSTPIRRRRSPTASGCSTWWRPTSSCSPAATCRSRRSATPPNPAAAMSLCR